jgi:excinuclease ABC subunit C
LDDGARYFGPYFSASSVRQALKILRRIFPFATKKPVGQKRANLDYHLGLDPGLEKIKHRLPNIVQSLRKLIAIIEGKRQTIIKDLEKKCIKPQIKKILSKQPNMKSNFCIARA